MALAQNNLNPILSPNSYFGTGILGALPFANMAQSPYPPLGGGLSVDKLAAMEQETLEVLKQASFLIDFIASRQQSTLNLIMEEVQNPAATLLWKYVYKGILVHTRPAWALGILERDITIGPHVSACTTKITGLICGEMNQHV